MEWLDIESAPKDGTYILVYPSIWNNKTCAIAKWNPDEYSKNPRPFWDHDDNLNRVTESRNKQPTHWMPLPVFNK